MTADEARARRAVRERDGNCCADCGMVNKDHTAKYGRGLHVHRLVPGSRYTVEGCILVCTPCHWLRHGAKQFKAQPIKFVPRNKGFLKSVSVGLSEVDLADLDTLKEYVRKKLLPELYLSNGDVIRFLVRTCARAISRQRKYRKNS
jgi:hypothetical protein